MKYQMFLVPTTMSLVATVLIGMTGCSALGYRVGSSLPAGIKTVHIPTFINNTGEPLLESDATLYTVQEFQRDLTLEIADRNSADTIVDVTLSKIEIIPLRYETDNIKTAKEYRLRIDADFTFKKRATGQLLNKSSVYGESTFEPAGDLGNAKRSALPAASRDLAHQIVKRVVEFW